MKRYEFSVDGVAQGIIEALDEKAALATAWQEYPRLMRDPRRWPKLTRDMNAMHVLIDATNWRAIARHDSRKALAALALIQFANIECRILRLGENKVWAAFTADQIRAIGASIGVPSPAPDAKYSDIIKAIRTAVEAVDYLALPFTTEDLSAQAYAVSADDARPLGFDPGASEPKVLKKWPCDPQRPSKRRDSSFWLDFSAGLGYGPGITTPEAVAHLGGQAAPAAPQAPAAPRRAPPAPPTGKAATPAAPKAPKAPRAPAAAGERPKAGTTTGRVWELADAVLARMPATDWKAFRAEVTRVGEAEGINAGTIGVQLGKWKASTQT